MNDTTLLASLEKEVCVSIHAIFVHIAYAQTPPSNNLADVSSVANILHSMLKKINQTRECHDHRSQTNPLHRDEETNKNTNAEYKYSLFVGKDMQHNLKILTCEPQTYNVIVYIHSKIVCLNNMYSNPRKFDFSKYSLIQNLFGTHWIQRI